MTSFDADEGDRAAFDIDTEPTPAQERHAPLSAVTSPMPLPRWTRRVARATRLVGGMALALVIVGCSDAEAPTTPAPSAATRIQYTQSGGIAGVSDRLVVSTNRTAVLTTRRATFRRSLSRAQHRRLLRTVQDARLERLRARYVPAKPVPDGLERSLRFRGRSVIAADGASWPPALTRAIDALAVLVSNMQQS